MPFSHRVVPRSTFRAAVAALLALSGTVSSSVSAQPTIGDAHVISVDGKPCFSIPHEGGSRANIHLYSLAVTETERTDWRTLAKEMWGFTVDPPGLAADGASDTTCIRYGRLPAAARNHGAALPLQPSRLYRVEITARPDGKAGANGGASTRGYELGFCVMPSAHGLDEVRSVLRDQGSLHWREEVCAK